MLTKRFDFNSSLLEFNSVNSGFAKIKLSVMSEEVANGTHFRKEVIDKRLNGLNYLPIVMEYKEEKQDAGSHGGKLEISDDGFKFIDTTKPYGVVIQDTAKWEEVKLKNGETKPYVTVEGYVWLDRYPELECLYDGKQNNQSMEVNILDGFFDEKTWIYEINDFEFSALCILGADVKPAFPEAKVSTDYSKQDFKADYMEMINALNIYLQNNGKEVFSLNENEILDTENTEEFETEEIAEPEEFNKETETPELETDENEEFEEVEETQVEEESDEFTEDELEEEAVDYEKLYNELKIEFDKLTVENERLSEFEVQAIRNEKESVLQDFASKLDEEELSSIDIDNLTKEQIEEKCFAMIGKKQAQFSKEEKTNKKVTINFNHTKTSSDWLSVLADETRK